VGCRPNHGVTITIVATGLIGATGGVWKLKPLAPFMVITPSGGSPVKPGPKSPRQTPAKPE
jgi:hypothetical protein